MFRILVIDDDKDLRDNIAEILEEEAYGVLRAEHGAMGIQMAQAHLPDLIICDVMMPGMDGYAVVEELQKSPATAVIPFLFLTANTGHASLRHAMTLGADDYLTKPFSSQELLSAISRRLEKRAIMTQRFEQQFDELRGNLISLLPHEMRTPLSTIMGYANLIALDYKAMDREEIESMAQTIARSGKRLQHVIENYLLYARLELQRHDQQAMDMFSKQQFEAPGLLIKEVARQTAETFERENDLTVRTEDAVVQISREFLKKIIEEIVSNTFKFSNPTTKVIILAKRKGERYILQVSDQGRGMTAEQISRVGAYVQFERKLYEQQGMGLGLILARRLAEIHGGDLMIRSEIGRGTVISVILQLAL